VTFQATEAFQLPFGDRGIVAVIGALQLRLHPRALAPIATPEQIIVVLGDFTGDIWLLEL